MAITASTNDDHGITSNNQLYNYSPITAVDGFGLLASCVTGVGPTSSYGNSAVGGWYFGGRQLNNQGCRGNGITVFDSEYAGIYKLEQCGTLSTAHEGVYSCQIIDTEMAMKLGVYLNGRSKCDLLLANHVVT